MEIVIIILILAYVGFKANSFLSKLTKPSKKRKKYSCTSQSDNENSDYHKFEFGLIPDGYFYHEMVGMYYRGITTKDFGVFYGRAVAETNNPKDKHAIGIYRNSDNKLVGYLPKEERCVSNVNLHKSILYYGGSTGAIFRIQGSSRRSYGAVYVEEVNKVFRNGDEKNPYTARRTEKFGFYPLLGINGKSKCYIGINKKQKEFDYTVSLFNETGEVIGKTDDDQLRLFDYVAEKGNNLLAWYWVDFDTQKAVLNVPLNFTEKEVERKLKKFLEDKPPVLIDSNSENGEISTI